MTTMAPQITSLTVVYSTVYSVADQRKHQSSASLAFVWGIHRDRWIPRTNGQLRGKCFHVMTSSWMWAHSDYIREIGILITGLNRVITWCIIDISMVHQTNKSLVSQKSYFIVQYHATRWITDLFTHLSLFSDDIFRCIFVNEEFCILIEISL